VNQAIAGLLTRLNQRPFRKREGSRATLFAQLDRPALKLLPAARYEFGTWQATRVNLDYHVEVERHYYSVPYELVHQKVDVRLTAETVEVLRGGVRVASHARSYEAGRATTLTDLPDAGSSGIDPVSHGCKRYGEEVLRLLAVRTGDSERVCGAVGLL
jgi:hypothetical protein